jgi:flagellar protein FlaG
MNISSISNLSSQLSASATQSAQVTPPKPTQSQKALLQAVKTVNAAEMFGQENELTFKIDKAAGIAVVRIVNRETGELVEQIPTEEVLKMAEESNRG